MLKQSSQLKAYISDIDQALFEVIGSDTPTLENLRTFTIESGGKRIRPIFFKLICESFGNFKPEAYHIAAILEIIHAASLLHDDVIDEAGERRGKPSGKKLFGNKKVVLGGDYLLACGIHRLNQFEDSTLMAIFTHVIRELSIAEIIQMENEQNLELDKATYQRIIYGKTAALFEAAGFAAGQYCGLQNDTMDALGEFGNRLGLYFQMRDDILDYFNPELLKKAAYTDFINGLVTYPLLLLKEEAGSHAAQILTMLALEPSERKEKKTLKTLAALLEESKAKEICLNTLSEQEGLLADSMELLPAGEPKTLIQDQLDRLKI